MTTRETDNDSYRYFHSYVLLESVHLVSKMYVQVYKLFWDRFIYVDRNIKKIFLGKGIDFVKVGSNKLYFHHHSRFLTGKWCRHFKYKTINNNNNNNNNNSNNNNNNNIAKRWKKCYSWKGVFFFFFFLVFFFSFIFLKYGQKKNDSIGYKNWFKIGTTPKTETKMTVR